MLGHGFSSAAVTIRAVPQSNNTVGRCVYHMTKDLKEQLNEKMCTAAFLCTRMNPLTGTKTGFFF